MARRPGRWTAVLLAVAAAAPAAAIGAMSGDSDEAPRVRARDHAERMMQGPGMQRMMQERTHMERMVRRSGSGMRRMMGRHGNMRCGGGLAGSGA